MTGLLRGRFSLNLAVATTLSIILSAVTLSMTCVLIVWSQSKDDQIVEE